MDRYVETQRLGGLEVDDKLILRRRLHRHVCGLFAFEDAVDVTNRLPPHVDPIRPIGDQAACGDEGAIEVDRGQLVQGCQLNDQIAIKQRPPARGDDQTAIWGSREGRDGALDLPGVPLVERGDLHPE